MFVESFTFPIFFWSRLGWRRKSNYGPIRSAPAQSADSLVSSLFVDVLLVCGLLEGLVVFVGVWRVADADSARNGVAANNEF